MTSRFGFRHKKHSSPKKQIKQKRRVRVYLILAYIGDLGKVHSVYFDHLAALERAYHLRNQFAHITFHVIEKRVHGNIK